VNTPNVDWDAVSSRFCIGFRPHIFPTRYAERKGRTGPAPPVVRERETRNDQAVGPASGNGGQRTGGPGIGYKAQLINMSEPISTWDMPGHALSLSTTSGRSELLAHAFDRDGPTNGAGRRVTCRFGGRRAWPANLTRIQDRVGRTATDRVGSHGASRRRPRYPGPFRLSRVRLRRRALPARGRLRCKFGRGTRAITHVDHRRVGPR
jgi:hypothetical protein